MSGAVNLGGAVCVPFRELNPSAFEEGSIETRALLAAEKVIGHLNAGNLSLRQGSASRLASSALASENSSLRKVPVVCNARHGVFLIVNQCVVCHCGDCREEGRFGTMSPTEFERHCGMSSAKKWRQSIKVDNDGGEESVPIGRWLEAHGLCQRPTRTNGTRPPGVSNLKSLGEPQDEVHVALSAPQGQGQSQGQSAALLNISPTGLSGVVVEPGTLQRLGGVEKGGCLVNLAVRNGSTGQPFREDEGQQVAKQPEGTMTGTTIGGQVLQVRRGGPLPPGHTVFKEVLGPSPARREGQSPGDVHIQDDRDRAGPGAAAGDADGAPREFAMDVDGMDHDVGGTSEVLDDTSEGMAPKAVEGGPAAAMPMDFEDMEAVENLRFLSFHSETHGPGRSQPNLEVPTSPPRGKVEPQTLWTPRSGARIFNETMSDRLGPAYQATLPPLRSKPRLSEGAADLLRAGAPGPSEMEADLQTIEEYHKAMQKPEEAIADTWERAAPKAREPSVAVRERHERKRRPPARHQDWHVDPRIRQTNSRGGGETSRSAGGGSLNGKRHCEEMEKSEDSMPDEQQGETKKPKRSQSPVVQRPAGPDGAAAAVEPLPIGPPVILNWEPQGDKMKLTVAFGNVHFEGTLHRVVDPKGIKEPASHPTSANEHPDIQEPATASGPTALTGDTSPPAPQSDVEPKGTSTPSPHVPSQAVPVPPVTSSAAARPVSRGRTTSRTSPCPASRPEDTATTAAADTGPLTSPILPPAPPAGTRCSFCHQRCPSGPNAPKTGRRDLSQGLGPFLAVDMKPSSQSCWVHEQCALWSRGVHEEDGEMVDAPQAVRAGRLVKCAKCGDKGATVPCGGKVYHLPCVLEEGFTEEELAEELEAQNLDGPGSNSQRSVPDLRGCGSHSRPQSLPPSRIPAAPASSGGPMTASVMGAADAGATKRPTRGSAKAVDYAQMARGVSLPPLRPLPAGAPSKIPHVLWSTPMSDSEVEDRLEKKVNDKHKATGGGKKPAGGKLSSHCAPINIIGNSQGTSATERLLAEVMARFADCVPDFEELASRTGHDLDGQDLGGLLADLLGGTTGQPGRAGRCAVCVIQRKGKCGSESAPTKCLRRQLQLLLQMTEVDLSHEVKQTLLSFTNP